MQNKTPDHGGVCESTLGKKEPQTLLQKRAELCSETQTFLLKMQSDPVHVLGHQQLQELGSGVLLEHPIHTNNPKCAIPSQLLGVRADAHPGHTNTLCTQG